MRFLRSWRRLLWLAVLVPLIPASAHAGVFISVGFAPPPLLVYAQPLCPQPGWMWMPGYWAYGPDGYFWVPGTWVPAPYAGALWTPGYWGWNSGLYMWHPGYWARQVGYYGGVNYGYGYFGMGFAGGMWRGDRFMYNTAVMRVNPTIVRNTYIDRTVIRRDTIVNNHVAYNGGPGGIRHMPTEQERMADREQHMGRTDFQTQHVNAAMHDRAAYFNNNHGHPPVVAQQRPRPMSGGARGSQQSLPGQMRTLPQYRQRPQYQQRQPPPQREPQYQQRQPQYQQREQQQRQYQQRPPEYRQGGAEQRRQPDAQPRQEPRQDRPQQPPDQRWRDR